MSRSSKRHTNSKAKVVHHDKLKPYSQRKPLITHGFSSRLSDSDLLRGRRLWPSLVGVLTYWIGTIRDSQTVPQVSQTHILGQGRFSPVEVDLPGGGSLPSDMETVEAADESSEHWLRLLWFDGEGERSPTESRKTYPCE